MINEPVASASACNLQEEFKIAVRKGFTLLKSVRQLDKKPTPEQLSPTRLHNVTAIERMLVQLGTYLMSDVISRS